MSTRTPQRYRRERQDAELGRVTQYLERTKSGNAWRGWEVNEDGTTTGPFVLESLRELPGGYEPCESV